MKIASRLKRLEAEFATGGGCPVCTSPIREIISAPENPICPRCNQPRGDVLVIEEQIVAPFEEIAGSDVVK